MANAAFNTTPTSKSPNTIGFAGATPSISANGTSNGILWALDNSAYGSSGPAVLYAYSASKLSDVLYTSAQAAGGRDQAGAAVKFTVPTVVNGKVYVGGESSLTIYGLLSSRFPGVAASEPCIQRQSRRYCRGQIDLLWRARRSRFSALRQPAGYEPDLVGSHLHHRPRRCQRRRQRQGTDHQPARRRVFLAQAAGHRRQRRPAQPVVHCHLQRWDEGDLHSVDQRLAYAAELHGRVARSSPCLTAISSNGTKDNQTFYLYGYSFALNPAKTVSSLTLPNDANVEIIAATLDPRIHGNPGQSIGLVQPDRDLC